MHPYCVEKLIIPSKTKYRGDSSTKVIDEYFILTLLRSINNIVVMMKVFNHQK